MIHKILCFFGFHTPKNTDGRGLAGEYRCKHCDEPMWEAIVWPDPPEIQ
jgi:hypothetical protein